MQEGYFFRETNPHFQLLVPVYTVLFLAAFFHSGSRLLIRLAVRGDMAFYRAIYYATHSTLLLCKKYSKNL